MNERQREFLRRKFAREAVLKRQQGDTISRLRLQGVSEEILSRIEFGAGKPVLSLSKDQIKNRRHLSGGDFEDSPDILDEN